MDTKKKIELIAASIDQLESALFLEKLEEKFWSAQALASKQYEPIKAQVQTKVKIMENKIPFLKDQLKDIEKGE